MNNFSNINGPTGISNSTNTVWKIEKKRKARDKKNRQQKQLRKEYKNREEDDDSVLVDIELDRVNDKECEDQTGYGPIKKKKSQRTKIDLKI